MERAAWTVGYPAKAEVFTPELVAQRSNWDTLGTSEAVGNHAIGTITHTADTTIVNPIDPDMTDIEPGIGRRWGMSPIPAGR